MRRYPAEVPENYRTIIALIDAGDLGRVPMTGYFAEVGANLVLVPYGRGPVFAAELVTCWDYLADVAPQYDLTEVMP